MNAQVIVKSRETSVKLLGKATRVGREAGPGPRVSRLDLCTNGPGFTEEHKSGVGSLHFFCDLSGFRDVGEVGMFRTTSRPSSPHLLVPQDRTSQPLMAQRWESPETRNCTWPLVVLVAGTGRGVLESDCNSV